MQSQSFVLASASPRRRHLLAGLGVRFEVVVADVDEAPEPSEPAEALARRLARDKALTGAERRPRAAVLAADTVVALGDRLLGKPADAEEARAMLRTLRDRSHLVVTGLALATGSGAELVWHAAVETRVDMRAYTDDEIERYVATGRPLDKAGGYAIQDPEFAPVARIVGCYPNVVGLPLCETRQALAAAGLLSKLPPNSDAAIGPERPDCRLCVTARAIEPPA